MPTDLLPRRPYAELPPPPDGFAAALAEAGRRRRRRGVIAGASATAALVAVVVLVLGGGAGGDAVLRPAPVAPAAPASSPPAHGSTLSPPRAATDRGRRVPVPASAGPRASTNAGTVPGPGTQSRSPITLSRTRGSHTGSPQVCHTGDNADNNTGVSPGSDWCPEATATAVAGGERLAFTLCRDSTSGGSLTFATSREVDLVVERGSTVVWSWSHEHPGTSSPHTLSAPANGCWTWSLVWPDTTQSGAAAGHGAYTLVATSTADELRYSPQNTADFDY